MNQLYGQEYQQSAIEKNYREITQSLQTYNELIPGPIFMNQLMMHPHGLEVVKQIAAQDAMWQTRPDKVLTVLIGMIRSTAYPISHTLIAHALNVFLTAAEQKGYPDFVNRITFISNDTILEAAVATENAECALIALKHSAKTRN